MAFVLISKQEKPVDKDAEESQVIYLFQSLLFGGKCFSIVSLLGEDSS